MNLAPFALSSHVLHMAKNSLRCAFVVMEKVLISIFVVAVVYHPKRFVRLGLYGCTYFSSWLLRPIRLLDDGVVCLILRWVNGSTEYQKLSRVKKVALKKCHFRHCWSWLRKVQVDNRQQTDQGHEMQYPPSSSDVRYHLSMDLSILITMMEFSLQRLFSQRC